MFYQLQKSNLNTYLLYCWNITNYIYILKRFRKLVIIFFIAKNTLNLINLSSFHGVKIVTWQKKKKSYKRKTTPCLLLLKKKKKIHIKNFLPTSTTPRSYNLKIKKFKTTYSSYKNKKKKTTHSQVRSKTQKEPTHIMLKKKSLIVRVKRVWWD